MFVKQRNIRRILIHLAVHGIAPSAFQLSLSRMESIGPVSVNKERNPLHSRATEATRELVDQQGFEFGLKTDKQVCLSQARPPELTAREWCLPVVTAKKNRVCHGLKGR